VVGRSLPRYTRGAQVGNHSEQVCEAANATSPEMDAIRMVKVNEDCTYELLAC
jgi:hypothetical protein